jgi:hypothetical protein
MSPEVLTRLLRGEHLNMEKRSELGAWPHPPIPLGEVVDHLVAVLEKERWFPREWQPHDGIHNVHEGGVIERAAAHRFVYRYQRAHPTQPAVLAEEFERMFATAREAAEFYLKWDLNLPGDLDGWKVV